MDRLNRMLASAGGMGGGLNNAAPGSVSFPNAIAGLHGHIKLMKFFLGQYATHR
jgi:hypothetical protein